MKNFFLKNDKKNVILFLICLPFFIFSQENIKKEIHVPFPETIAIDELTSKEKKNPKTIQPKKEPVKNTITIPFPNDKIENKSPKVEMEHVEINASIKGSSKDTSSTNGNLPLESIFVYPKFDSTETINTDSTTDSKNVTEIKENGKHNAQDKTKSTPIATPTTDITKEVKKTKVIENPKSIETIKKEDKPAKIEVPETDKPTNEVGKALTEKTKTIESSVPQESKVIGIEEYKGKEARPSKNTKKTPAKSVNPVVDTKKAAEKKMETKEAKTASGLPTVTNLPNIEKPSSKKGKDKNKVDESTPPYERSKYYLNRDDKHSSIPELNASSSSEGEKANLAKMDQIRLFAIDRKKNEAKNIIEGISDPEVKFKGLYELAVGLENSAKGDKKLKEEAIPFHLTIITEAPKTNPIVPKSLWALSHLLYSIGDFTPALDHLSDIILSHANSEFADDAVYLSGRIYEESPTIRNLNRAKKYYELFMKNISNKNFAKSKYLPFVENRLKLLEN